MIDKEIATKRLEVFSESGATFIERMVKEGKQNSYDAVIIDCTDFADDEDSIAAELFTPAFYTNIN